MRVRTVARLVVTGEGGMVLAAGPSPDGRDVVLRWSGAREYPAA
jgi:hypothetical protein